MKKFKILLFSLSTVFSLVAYQSFSNEINCLAVSQIENHWMENTLYYEGENIFHRNKEKLAKYTKADNSCKALGWNTPSYVSKRISQLAQ